MRKQNVTLIFLGIIAISCLSIKLSENNMKNPFLSEYETPFQAPPFNNIESKHYMPAFNAGMAQQKAIVSKIINNNDLPTFENTIEVLENSDEILNKVGAVFYNLKIANTNSDIQAISKELAPILASHYDDINLNQALFSKIKILFDHKDNLNLTTEQNTLLERTYQNFVRGGAKLNSDDASLFRDINKALSLLYLQFSDNVLAENNRFELIIENEKDLEGLSQNSIDAAAERAKEKGHQGKWFFTIHNPSLVPFLETAKNRDLREKMYKAYITKCNHNDSLDNKTIIDKIVNLRIKRAQLLGYNTHADYILEQNMAKTSGNVYKLLNELMPSALNVAKTEVAAMQKIINNEGGGFKLEPWDYPYYAAKVKEEKYAINESEIRPYLELKSTRDGMFWVANQLYGISFTQRFDLPVYYSDVEVFEVKESTGEHIGILYLDYYPRESKKSGAWCTNFRPQKYLNGNKITPLSSIVCNFTAPVGNTPSLLTVDETTTLFHEFGHALDGLFSNKHYSSLNTPRDFVELPSQIMENWAFAPEVLAHYAKHYITGENIPAAMVDKITNSSKFNQGFATTEYLAAAYLDMGFHTLNKVDQININEFETELMEQIQLIREIDPRYRSTYFQHIFSGNSYSSGYYSYIYAEVLDADAFNEFKKNGIFNKTTASSFRTNILELGGTQDAMLLYQKFKGANPSINALLERKGLK